MTGPLALCRWCGRYARTPVHLVGVARRIGSWSPRLPLPAMRWCGPGGLVDLPFHQTPGDPP